MASMMGGDLVETYVLRNLYKEKMEEMAKEMKTKKKPDQEMKRNRRRGLFGFGFGFVFGIPKKKVAPTTSCSGAKAKP
jgi:hypothetical protein